MAQTATAGLTKRFFRYIDDGVRSRGLTYFRRGAVHVISQDEDGVAARVQGSDLYTVKLMHDRDQRAVVASCTCPYAMDQTEVCKHIWATLLVADEHRLLAEAANDKQIDLVLDEPDGSWEEDDVGVNDFDDADDEKDDPPIRSRPPIEKVAEMIANMIKGRGVDWKKTKTKKPAPPPIPGWQRHLNALRSAIAIDSAPPKEHWPPAREVWYVVQQPDSATSPELVVDLMYRQPKQNGEMCVPKTLRVKREELMHVREPGDREIISLLQGAADIYDGGYQYSYSSYNSHSTAASRFKLLATNQALLVPMMCRTGHCAVRLESNYENPLTLPLRWDDGPPWQFNLQLVRARKGDAYLVEGSLRREQQHVPLAEPKFIFGGGIVITADGVAARLDDAGAFEWILLLRQIGNIPVPRDDAGNMVQSLLNMPRLPHIELPEELRYEEVRIAPRPRLKIRKPDERSNHRMNHLVGELTFEYDQEIVEHGSDNRGVLQIKSRRFILRDRDAERNAEGLLRCLDFKDPPRDLYASYRSPNPAPPVRGLEIHSKKFGKVVRELTQAGWYVEAEGKILRQPGEFKFNVESGIDWFELHGQVAFGDQVAQLPQLLAAIKRGESTVRLDDGTYGIVPEQWLEQYGSLAGLGKNEEDHVRFSRTQVGLLDALLASQPSVNWDHASTKARQELMRFEGVGPIDPPNSFTGELRPYQRDGLGWLEFLQRFGLGGCLADDMGLGKTVQVLAMLEARRRDRKLAKSRAAKGKKPSLVVMPRSLVFNWKQEAAKFTPELTVMNHTGVDRCRDGAGLKNSDVILTTYGTLRRDAAMLKDVEFDYVILDEAQSIKNADTAAAKAARLLQGNHRLAMSGTPVENHLGELWSLFEFLNPGMLGSATSLKLNSKGVEDSTRQLLARALRPFILRRTKEQVAKDLPAKTEQTIFCEMESDQRRIYNDLREHFRQSLLKRVQTEGINKSKIQILEALLRLRQAACHPGLIDKSRCAEPCAKLDVLLPRLLEVTEEGHKALVFSQFTSLLSIVKPSLDAQKITYEYLDGKTRDRAAKVDRFQNDPDCKLFLISLKAGGLGLNLTAADYVFLLDPWWNPAVEAQAIDRAHRIGQTKQVFAYRLIARDTVEEKVLQLQQSKRELADAIIKADDNLIRNLGREDLEMLLG